MKQLDATVSNFDTVFEKFRSEAPNNKANLILFLADKDPSTSLSWCPGTFFSPIFVINIYTFPWSHDRILDIFILFLQIVRGFLVFCHNLLIRECFYVPLSLV